MSPPDSTRDVTQDDFLFHLYRGSELLQDDRILEAKEELEQALTMQPRDAKGQDLLGAVYFRLGLYPRAIQIYEGLEAQFPVDVAIKINLALSYLKTGQPEPARRVLRDVVHINPEHTRAWGYLGLALQKLGELEQAQIAFEKGNRPTMARKVTEIRRSLMPPAPDSQPAQVAQDVRDMAQEAFSELDAGQIRFELAAAAPHPLGDGTWHTLELGRSVKKNRTPAPKSPYSKTLPPPWMGELEPDPPTLPPPSMGLSAPPVPRLGRSDAPWGAPSSAGLPIPLPPVSRVATIDELREPPAAHVAPPLLANPSDPPVMRRASGVVVVQVGEDASITPAAAGSTAFATRVDALRVVSGQVATRILYRRVREADTSEVLGGLGSPLVRIAGPGQLVLAPRPGHALALFEVDDGLAFVREDLLVGFPLSLQYENGKVPLDVAVGEGVPVVQLRGRGPFVIEVLGTLASLASLPTVSGKPLLVQRDWVVGWLGRLVTRTLPSTESPGGHRGLLAFSGEGTVLVNAG